MDAEAVSPEFRLLAACLRPCQDKAKAGAIQAAASDRIDWPLLLRLAERHRVTPAMAAALHQAGVEVPATLAAPLSAAAARAAFEELALANLAQQILDDFAEAQIRVIILKGLPLSMAIHGRLGLRVSRDIDLLVSPSDAARALARLIDIGLTPPDNRPFDKLDRYAKRHKDIELFDRNRLQTVELHWRLFDNSRLLPLPELIPASEGQIDAQHSCLVLPSRLNLLYLCNHGAQHAWSRLKWLADVAALLFELGPDGRERLYAEALPHEGRRAVGQALLLCDSLFGMAAPPDLAKDMRLNWLTRIAMRALIIGSDMEMEKRSFGSTLKNFSHYMLYGHPAYLLEEAWFDITDMSSLPVDSSWRKFGIIGRLGGWATKAFRTS